MATKPWWNVSVPHKDIRDGKFDESVFAANLADVANGKAPEDYQDPELFFQKTYLTKGLTNLLLDVSNRLTGAGKGDPVIQVQTVFGGGKTHSLVALYHFFKNSKQLGRSKVIKAIAPKSATSLEQVESRESLWALAPPQKARHFGGK